MPSTHSTMSAVFSKPFHPICTMELVRWPEDEPFDDELPYRTVGTLLYLQDRDDFYQFDLEKLYYKMAEALGNQVINLFEYNQYKTVAQLLELGFHFPRNRFLIWDLEGELMMSLESFLFQYCPDPVKMDRMDAFYTLPDLEDFEISTDSTISPLNVVDWVDDISEMTGQTVIDLTSDE